MSDDTTPLTDAEIADLERRLTGDDPIKLPKVLLDTVTRLIEDWKRYQNMKGDFSKWKLHAAKTMRILTEAINEDETLSQVIAIKITTMWCDLMDGAPPESEDSANPDMADTTPPT